MPCANLGNICFYKKDGYSATVSKKINGEVIDDLGAHNYTAVLILKKSIKDVDADAVLIKNLPIASTDDKFLIELTEDDTDIDPDDGVASITIESDDTEPLTIQGTWDCKLRGKD